MDFCGVLIGIGIALGVIAVIGHGLWMMAAAVLRTVFSAEHTAHSEHSVRYCPSCRFAVRTDRRICPRCETAMPAAGFTGADRADSSSEADSLEDEVDVAVRQILGLAESGALTAAESNRLCMLLRRQQLVSGSELVQVRRASGAAGNRPAGQSEITDVARTESAAPSTTAQPPSAPPATPAGNEPDQARELELEDFLEEVETELPAAPQPDQSPRPRPAPTRQFDRKPSRPTRHEPVVSSDQAPIESGSSLVPAGERSAAPSPAGSSSVSGGDERGVAARGLAHVAAAFMEERNIRWGELISGMLIIGSASGLVISLWSSLDAIPYFPALIFLVVTASLHGAGLYTLNRWKLRSTSRGLLLISTLLIPLNFVGAIALSEGDVAVTDPFYVIAVGVGVVVFSWLAWSTGRILMLRGSWMLMAAMMLPAVGQLVIARQATPQSDQRQLLMLMALPALGYIGALVSQLRFAASWQRLTPRRVQQMLLMPGLATFSLLVPLILLCTKTRDLSATLAAISPVISLVSMALASAGLWLHARLTEPRFNQQRTAGTAIALLGAGGMALALAQAWPDPANLIAIGLFNVVTLTLLALVANFAALHVPGVLSLVFAGLITFLRINGMLPDVVESHQLVSALLMGRSAVFVAACGLVAGLISRWSRQRFAEFSQCYDFAHQLLVLVSLLAAIHAGWVSGRDASLATLVMLLATLEAWWRTDSNIRPRFRAGLASAGILLTSGHLFAGNPWFADHLLARLDWTERPWLLAFVLTSTVLTGILMAWDRLRRDRSDESAAQSEFWSTQLWIVQGLALISVAAILVFARTGVAGRSLELGWMAVLLTAIAFLVPSAVVLLAAYVTTHGAVGLLTTHWCRQRDWWSGAESLQHLQWQLASAVVVAASWTVMRRAERWWKRLRQLNSEGPIVEPWVLFASSSVFCVLTIAALIPLVPQELPLQGRLKTNPAFIFMGLVSAGVFFGHGWSRLLCGASRWRYCLTVLLAVLGGSVAFSIPAPSIVDDWIRFSQHWSLDLPTGLVLGILLTASIVMVVCRRQLPQLLSVAGLVIIGALLPALRYQEQIGATTVLRWELVIILLGICGVMWWRERQADADLATSPAATWSLAKNGPRVDLLLSVQAVLVMILMGLSVRAGSTLLLVSDARLFAESSSIQIWLNVAGPVVALLCGLMLAGTFVRSAADIANVALWGVPIAGQFLLVLIHHEQFEGWNESWISLNGSASGFLLATALVAAWKQIGPSGDAARVGGSGDGRASVSEWFRDAWERTPGRIGSGVAVCLYAVGALLVLVRSAEFHFDTPSSEWLANACGAATVLAACGCLLWMRRGQAVIEWVGAGCCSALLVTSWIAVWQYSVTEPTSWTAFRCLQAGSVLTLVGLSVAVSWRPKLFAAAGQSHSGWLWKLMPIDSRTIDLVPRVQSWLAFLVLLVLGLGLRNVWVRELRLEWALVSVALAAASLVMIGVRTRDQATAVGSIVVACCGVAFYWLKLTDPPQYGWDEWWLRMLLANVLCVQLFAIVWNGLARWLVRDSRGSGTSSGWFVPGITQRAALWTLLGLLAVTLMRSQVTGYQPHAVFTEWWGWSILVLAAVNLVMLYQWNASRWALPEIYLSGIGVPLLVLHQLQPVGDRFAVFGELSCSIWNLAAAILWAGRRVIATGMRQLGLRLDHEQKDRLFDCGRAVSIVLLAAAAALGTRQVLSLDQLTLRMVVALMTACVALSLVLWAVRRADLSVAMPGLLGIALAFLHLIWARDYAEVAIATRTLQRVVDLIVATGTFAGLYGLILVRLTGQKTFWNRMAQYASVILGAVSLVALFVTLGLEWQAYQPATGVGLSWFAITIVAVMLVALMATLISFAVLPGRDPFSLSPTGRMGYVYASELIMALLFMHLYFSLPELFSGRFRQYWPYIVMAIAFVGVGVGELLQRYRVRVVAEPLQTTGAFLPILPVLALWIGGGMHLSGILFLAGLLYVMLSMWRRSLYFAIGAALAGNGGLWALLSETGFSVLTRPQMFMIPPALSALCAAQLNRQRLDEKQLTAIRYISMTAIYVSSTGEMFINGVATNFWLPMILALISVAGVFAGIVMRIRAFLYLGSSFLLLSLISMVWHATVALQHSWPWWVFGIVLGLLILVFFGLFEKRRQDMLQVLEDLRQWDR